MQSRHPITWQVLDTQESLSVESLNPVLQEVQTPPEIVKQLVMVVDLHYVVST